MLDKNSTIFRTINTDAKRLTEQFGLLGKSFRDIKKDFANGLGVKNSLFQTSISKSDWQSLQKFNSAIKVTNDGLTKSQRITKAWNENMTGCSMAAKRMGNDLITGKKKISDVSTEMKTATDSTKALGIAMNIFANVGFMLAITAITKVVSELAQAQSNAVQAAQEATEAYNDELSSIEDYKTRLSELHEELNSGNLSYEETKTKRAELMSIQDELIEKFGTEKGAIESVTEAVKGQVDALDDLNDKSYRDWVAKADKETIWTKLLPWGKSGLDQAIDYMETNKTVSFYDMANANSTTQDKYQAPITDEIRAIQEEIDKTIQSKYNLEKEFATFKLTGTPDEIKSQLESIRQDYLDLSKEAFLENGISSKYWDAYRSEALDSINEVINSFDEGLKKHQETYQTYIEGMIKYDSEYSDEYATILQKRAELESAENSGNEDDIKKARQKFMDAINSGIEASGNNENVKKYFESLYPELQAEFANWNFEFSINANTDGLAEQAKEIGEKYSATDLLDMINTEGIQEGEESFNKLIDKAIEYGVCTDNSAEEVQKLIDLLVELGIVQGKVQDSTLSNKTDILSSAIDNISTSLTSITDAQELFNTALSEQAQNGTISEDTLASLKEKYKDLDKVLEITTNGVVINRDKLAELNAEEEKSIKKDLSKTRKELIDQYNANSLAIASYKLQLEEGTYAEGENKETIKALLDAKREDQKQTEEQLAQMDLLGVKYDELTSKSNKFLQSLSSADDGAIYDSVVSALEQVKQVYDAGDYGKDEFRNFVDYMTADDMSTASIDEVKESYKSAMKTAQRYFTENNKGMKNFTNDLKKLKVASRDANGNWTLNIENMDKLSKKLGISSDAAKDLLDKLKDKGWEINFFESDDGLVDTDKQLDKLEKKLDKMKDKRLKLIADDKSTEKIDKQILDMEKNVTDIKIKIKFYSDQSQAIEEVQNIQKKINKLSNTYVNKQVNKDEIKSLKGKQKKLAKDYDFDLKTVLKVNTDKADKKVKKTKDEAKKKETFVVDAKTQAAKTAIKEVTDIFNKTYKLKVGIQIPQVESIKQKVKNVIKNVTGKDDNSNKKDADANGTVITGKAYANGKRGKIAHGYKSKALVGELGAEMRVRDGKYEILGENGAEFTDVRPDDIIFNAKQTEEILKNGRTNARGNAYKDGKDNTRKKSVTGNGMDIKTHTTSDKAKEAKKKREDEEKRKKEKKAASKFNQAIDWCAQSLGNLSRVFDRLSSKLENTSSYDKKLKIQDQIIAQQKKIVSGYKKSSSAYKKEYTQSLKAKGVKKYKSAIESGKKFSVQDFKSESLYNKVTKAQDAYNKWQDEVSQKQEAEYKLAQERLNKIQIQIDKQTSLIERDEAKLNASNTSNYKTRNDIIENIIKNQKESYRLQIAMAKTDAERVKLQNELKASVAEYRKQQFDNIQTKYDNASNLNRTKQSRYQSQIDLKEAKGEQVGSAYYEALIRYNNSDIDRKKEEVTALQKSLNASVKNGSIQKYSQEWYDMTTAIYEAKNAVDDLEKSNVEANNSLKELANTRFENLITQFDRLQSNMEFMSDLLDYEELYDDNGKMTDAGIAKMGVMFSNLETQKNKNEQTTNRVDDLQSKIIQAQRTGAKSLTFEGAEYSMEQATEKLAELNATAQEGVLDYKSLEKSIGDFLEEGIQAQIDAYNELIDKKKEALDAEQDLYEFQKKMKESTQDIILLERQLAALNGDDSDEARKKRRQLEKQLKDAKDSQSDDLRNRAIDMQKENLDKQAEKYQKDMQEKIKHISENFDEYINTVNQNSGDILKVLNEIAGKYGYTLPTDASQIFNGKENAVSNPNSTTSAPSATKTTNEAIIQEQKAKNNNAEQGAKLETKAMSEDINKVIGQDVDKTTALKEKVNNIVQRGSTKSVKKMNKKQKAKALKGETELNKYLIEKKSKKLSASLQLELAKALGFKKLTTKTVVTDKNSKKIKDKLKKAKIGYAKGGYINTVDLMDVAKSNGDTGWISAKNGEYVLTKAQTNGYLQLAKIAPEFVNAAQSMMDNINLTTNFPSYLSNGVQPQSVDNSVNITVEGNADTATVNDIRRIAEDVVNRNQANLQRMAHNKGARISPWKR